MTSIAPSLALQEKTVTTVRRLGFLLADVPAELDHDSETDDPLGRRVIDWDAYHFAQRVAMTGGRKRHASAFC